MYRKYNRENDGKYLSKDPKWNRADKFQADTSIGLSNTRRPHRRRNTKILKRRATLAALLVIILVLSIVLIWMLRGTESREAAAQATSPSPQPTAEPCVQQAPAKVLELYGKCRVTAYCSCAKCCGKYAYNRPKDENGKAIVYGAAGVPLKQGVSVASPLPLGTKISIPGLGNAEYIVQDRTAKWVANKYKGMIVDVYFDNHKACWEWLRSHNTDYFDVYIVKKVK